MTSVSTFSIARRFCGPPDSGNGGYVAGTLAAALGGNAKVRLHAPPPLERELRIECDDREAKLLDDDQLLASGVADLDPIEVPPALSAEAAERAAARSRVFEEHVFPTCFVCGPDRAEGDGLRIFAGPHDPQARIVAAPWTPDASLCDGSGRVRTEFLWAALDCPGAFSFPQPPTPVLLGELAVQVDAPVAGGETCVLVAHEVEHRGRKHRTATGLYGQSGELRARSLATWIELSA
ncbi:MAG: hypothetical protein AAF430_13145 [Myxococcota bacterium]